MIHKEECEKTHGHQYSVVGFVGGQIVKRCLHCSDEKIEIDK